MITISRALLSSWQILTCLWIFSLFSFDLSILFFFFDTSLLVFFSLYSYPQFSLYSLSTISVCIHIFKYFFYNYSSCHTLLAQWILSWQLSRHWLCGLLAQCLFFSSFCQKLYVGYPLSVCFA